MNMPARTCVAAAILWLLGGCSPLDSLGVSETVTEAISQGPKDDVLSDKHPVYDETLTVTERFGFCSVTLNKSASITRLSIEALPPEKRELQDRLFPTRADALAAIKGQPVIPSMEVVNGRLKPFNDGLYAAVELMVEEGSNGAPISKRALVDGILTELLARANHSQGARDAAVSFAAASRLSSDAGPSVPREIAPEVDTLLSEVKGDGFFVRPIGFYTWQPELETIYRRDRLLMYVDTDVPQTTQVVDALRGSPALLQSYRDVLALYAGLTNPSEQFSPVDVVDAIEPASASKDSATLVADFLKQRSNATADVLHWLPPSASPEVTLFNRMAREQGLPANLLDALIQAVQAGTVDLTPRANSGWYDRQLFALETLLAPERAPENDHLLLTREYKQKLIETFKSLLIQTRETHQKQLAVAASVSAPQEPIDLYPQLPVEPFPTFYLRTARAYAFLDSLLRASVGATALEATSRVLEDGTRAGKSLAQELSEVVRLTYGLHLMAAASIGMRDALTDEERSAIDVVAAEGEARSWIESFAEDTDVLRDPRVLVPVAITDSGDTYWGVAGVKLLRMHASFPKGFEPRVVNGGGCKIRDFVAFEPYLLVEQSFEVKRPAASVPLTRAEFRALCDKYQSVEAIQTALKAR